MVQSTNMRFEPSTHTLKNIIPFGHVQNRSRKKQVNQANKQKSRLETSDDPILNPGSRKWTTTTRESEHAFRSCLCCHVVGVHKVAGGRAWFPHLWSQVSDTASWSPACRRRRRRRKKGKEEGEGGGTRRWNRIMNSGVVCVNILVCMVGAHRVLVVGLVLVVVVALPSRCC